MTRKVVIPEKKLWMQCIRVSGISFKNIWITLQKVSAWNDGKACFAVTRESFLEDLPDDVWLDLQKNGINIPEYYQEPLLDYGKIYIFPFNMSETHCVFATIE